MFSGYARQVQLYLDYRGTANLEIFGLEEEINVSFSSNTVLAYVGNESIMEISEALKQLIHDIFGLRLIKQFCCFNVAGYIGEEITPGA